MFLITQVRCSKHIVNGGMASVFAHLQCFLLPIQSNQLAKLWSGGNSLSNKFASIFLKKVFVFLLDTFHLEFATKFSWEHGTESAPSVCSILESYSDDKPGTFF